jgi:hypothetical protein
MLPPLGPVFLWKAKGIYTVVKKMTKKVFFFLNRINVVQIFKVSAIFSVCFEEFLSHVSQRIFKTRANLKLINEHVLCK